MILLRRKFMSLTTKPNGLLSRAALFTGIGAAALVAIGYNSSAQAHRGPTGEPQALPPGATQKELPSILRNPDDASKQRQSFEKQVQPGYGIKVCCPPMTPALMANMFAFDMGSTMTADYSIKYATSTPGYAYFKSMMQAYANTLSAAYQGTAVVYPFFIIREKNCQQGSVKGYLWKFFIGSFGNTQTGSPYPDGVSPAGSMGLQVSMSPSNAHVYYIQPVIYIYIKPEKGEGFWLQQECPIKCGSFEVKAFFAKGVNGNTPTSTGQELFIYSDKNAILMRRDAKGRILQGDNLGQLRIGPPSNGDLAPEASDCGSCAN
jgi:hypothetical protein